MTKRSEIRKNAWLNPQEGLGFWDRLYNRFSFSTSQTRAAARQRDLMDALFQLVRTRFNENSESKIKNFAAYLLGNNALITSDSLRQEDQAFALESFEALFQRLEDAETKRNETHEDEDNTFNQYHAKTPDHYEQGYYALRYHNPLDESILLEICRNIKKIMDGNSKRKNTALASMLADNDDITYQPQPSITLSEDEKKLITQNMVTACNKHKPKGALLAFYLGKVSVGFTMIGAGLSGGLVAMFVAGSILGLPFPAVVLAGVIVFAIHFFIELILHRETTPRTMVRLFHSGVFNSDPDELKSMAIKKEATSLADEAPKGKTQSSRIAYWKAWAHKNAGAIYSIVVSTGSALLIASLTYVATISIFAGMGPLLPLIALALAAVSFITMGCLFFVDSYQITKDTDRWWRINMEKLFNNDKPSSHERLVVQTVLTVLSGLGILAILIWYCYTITALVFQGTGLGYTLTIGINTLAMGPFVISAAFDLGKTLTDLLDDTINIIAAKTHTWQPVPRMLALIGFGLIAGLTAVLWASVILIKRNWPKIIEQSQAFKQTIRALWDDFNDYVGRRFFSSHDYQPDHVEKTTSTSASSNADHDASSDEGVALEPTVTVNSGP